MPSKTLKYRCRVCVELYNSEDLELDPKLTVPFKTITLTDTEADATIFVDYNETDTDRGILMDESIEVDDVKVHRSHAIEQSSSYLVAGLTGSRLTGHLKSIVWDSAEAAIEKSQANDIDDVNMEADG
tara:strand:+ start:3175 stop:3558 length:384 start_codon:yes stop_codon:yes gene_type:complete